MFIKLHHPLRAPHAPLKYIITIYLAWQLGVRRLHERGELIQLHQGLRPADPWGRVRDLFMAKQGHHYSQQTCHIELPMQIRRSTFIFRMTRQYYYIGL